MKDCRKYYIQLGNLYMNEFCGWSANFDDAVLSFQIDAEQTCKSYNRGFKKGKDTLAIAIPFEGTEKIPSYIDDEILTVGKAKLILTSR